jgi:hypothetical protein
MALIDDKILEIETALAVVKAEAANCVDRQTVKDEVYAAVEAHILAQQTGHMVQLTDIQTVINGV